MTQGAGCSLMDRRTRFELIVRGMTAVASCPVTVKMRTGVHHRNWNAHKLLPRLQDWGVAMATVSVVLPTEVGLFISGTECANHFFSSTAFPSSFFLPSSFLPFLGFFSFFFFFFFFFLLSLLFYLLPLPLSSLSFLSPSPPLTDTEKVHGRSREQRYTKLADWGYISQCATAASPLPVFGCGDILSFEDYEQHAQGQAGIMIAR